MRDADQFRSLAMARLYIFLCCVLPMSGCLLFLDDPAEFPAPPPEVSCLRDAELPEDWEFKATRDSDEKTEETDLN